MASVPTIGQASSALLSSEERECGLVKQPASRFEAQRTFGSHAHVTKRAESKINRLAWSSYQKIKHSWMSKDIKIMNLDTLDLASRFNVAVAVYVPQLITSIATKTREWETNSRNVISWLVTLALGMWTKSKDGLPKHIDRWFMGEKSLKFDPQSLYRAEGIHSPTKGLSWTKLEVNLLGKIDDFGKELNNPKTQLGEQLAKASRNQLSDKELDTLEAQLRERFKLKPHEYVELAQKEGLTEAQHIAVAYAKKLRQKIPAFIKRINAAKFVQMAIATLLFTFVVGQGVMLLVWGTFARLDSEFDPGNNPLKGLSERLKNLFRSSHAKKETLPPSRLERFMRLPSRVAFDPQAKQQQEFHNQHQAYQGVSSW